MPPKRSHELKAVQLANNVFNGNSVYVISLFKSLDVNVDSSESDAIVMVQCCCCANK